MNSFEHNKRKNSAALPLTTQDNFADYDVVQTIGVVTGNVVRTKHLGVDFVAGIQSMFGGELQGYTQLTAEARQESIERLIANAYAVGADGIVGVRFTSSEITAGASELLAYGTAVKLQKK